MEELVIIGIPFVGTSLGAAMVLFMKGEMAHWLKKLLPGFAAGVMIAASVWSLLIPAIEMAGEQGSIAWLPAAAGFLLGIGFLMLLDRLVPRIDMEKQMTEGAKPCDQQTSMLVFAVTLHNLPEGMAVGVALAGALTENTGMTMAGVTVLVTGIAIQNLPEGSIISMPLWNAGFSRLKAFWYGVLSGVVEPVGAALTVLLAEQIVPFLPYLLAFAAGAMIYVVAEELIPEARSEEHSGIGTIGMAFGFVLMMILDVAT